MKRDLSLSAPTPVISAALRRSPGRVAIGGGGTKNFADNYVAKSPLTSGQNSGNRLGAGAPPGNRNALRHGFASAAAKARNGLIIRRFRELYRAIDAIVPIWRAGGDGQAQSRHAYDLMLTLEDP